MDNDELFENFNLDNSDTSTQKGNKESLLNKKRNIKKNIDDSNDSNSKKIKYE